LEQSSPHIGILFFSRSAKAESTAKCFTPDNDGQKNEKLAHRLIGHSYKQAKQSGLPVIFYDEDDQRGSTFGDRFANAFSAMFERGFEYVIAFGNDTPELSTEHIQKAAEQLRSGQADIILGPSADGGTWLTAFSKEAFSTDRFRQLPWQTSTLFDGILRQFGSNWSITSLNQFADIDDIRAFAKFISRKNHTLFRFVGLLQSVLAFPTSFGIINEHCYSSFSLFKNILLRAPPLR